MQRTSAVVAGRKSATAIDPVTPEEALELFLNQLHELLRPLIPGWTRVTTTRNPTGRHGLPNTRYYMIRPVEWPRGSNIKVALWHTRHESDSYQGWRAVHAEVNAPHLRFKGEPVRITLEIGGCPRKGILGFVPPVHSGSRLDPSSKLFVALMDRCSKHLEEQIRRPTVH